MIFNTFHHRHTVKCGPVDCSFTKHMYVVLNESLIYLNN